MPSLLHLIEGRFALGKYLRRGVLGDVWEGQDTTTRGIRVEVEFLDEKLTRQFEQLRGFNERFWRLAWPWFQHPAAVPIYLLGRQGGLVYVVMKHVEGDTLDQRLSFGTVDPRQAMAIARVLAGVLERAHASGIAHGGLSPKTVMVTREGQALALDVGLAAAWQGWERTPNGRDEPRLRKLRQVDVLALDALVRRLVGGPVSHSSIEPGSRGSRPSLPTAPPPLPPGVPFTLEWSWHRMLEHGAADRSGEVFLSQLASLGGPLEPAWPAGPARRGASGQSEAAAPPGEIDQISREPVRSRHPQGRQPRSTAQERRSELRPPEPDWPERPRPHLRPTGWGRRPSARHRFSRRTTLFGLLAAALVLTSTTVMVIFSGASPQQTTAPADRPTPAGSVSAPATLGIAVPAVEGMPVLAARARLVDVGLQFVEARPVAGPPGRVVASVPAAGTRIPRGSAVTLLVGATPDRVPSP